jgi:hypothetical protein
MSYFKTIVVQNQDNYLLTMQCFFSKLLIIRHKQNMACILDYQGTGSGHSVPNPL